VLDGDVRASLSQRVTRVRAVGGRNAGDECDALCRGERSALRPHVRSERWDALGERGGGGREDRVGGSRCQLQIAAFAVWRESRCILIARESKQR
jgi:hypothetical protein